MATKSRKSKMEKGGLAAALPVFDALVFPVAQKPPIPPPPPGIGGAASLGSSATIASVVIRRPATEAASCSAALRCKLDHRCGFASRRRGDGRAPNWRCDRDPWQRGDPAFSCSLRCLPLAPGGTRRPPGRAGRVSVPARQGNGPLPCGRIDVSARWPPRWRTSARAIAPEVLHEGFPQEELGVSRRIPVERAEHLVAESLIKWPGLEAVGLECRPDGAASARVGLCLLHEPGSVSGTAYGFGDPQTGHLQPASPELAEHPAQHVTVLTAQNEVDREVVGQAGSGDIVVVDAVHNELSRPLVDERLELASHRLHRVCPACVHQGMAVQRVHYRGSSATRAKAATIW